MDESLRRVVDAIPGLVWSADPSGSFDFLNQRWCEYTGLTLAEARGSGWQKAILPEDLPALLEHWQSLLSGGHAGESEARLRRHDGEYRWFLFRAVPLHDDAGRLLKWYGQSFDIDDRKRAEALLAGEKQLLEMVACGCALPIVLRALCVLVEQTAESCHCSVLLIDETRASVKHAAAPTLPDNFTGAIDGKPVWPYYGPCARAIHLKTQVIVDDLNEEVEHARGEWRELALGAGLRSCWTTPILAFDGEVLGTFALYRREAGRPSPLQLYLIERFRHLASIAIERTRREAALGRSEAFLAEGERLSSTGSFCWRVANDEIIWSEQTYRIYEYEPGTRITLALVHDRVHPDDKPLLEEVRAHRGDGDEMAFEHRIIVPDGSVKYLQIHAHARRDAGGNIEYYGAMRDVTERRRSEDALNRVRSELAHVARVTTLGALTASIAHEVNQPLSGIITNASTSLRMLADEPPNLEGARETARRTIRDAHRAADVVARLRSMFRKSEGTLEPVDLNEATREVLALMRNELQRARVQLRLELDGTLPPVRGDRVQLQQVVLNLLLNGFEAMSGVDERARVLAVRTELDMGERVRLTVQDSGTGFDPALADHLFEPFYTTKSSGMGMGLSISRSIIESLQGRLWAGANAGAGANFTFSVPRADAPPLAALRKGPAD